MIKIDQDYHFPALTLDLNYVEDPQTISSSTWKPKEANPDIVFRQDKLSGISSIGTRKHNIDKFQVKKHNSDLLIGLYDGHGEGITVNYVQQFLLTAIISNEWYQANLHKAIIQSFQQIDNCILSLQSQEGGIDGCVAIVTILRGQNITVVSLGDCRALVVHQSSPSKIDLKVLSIGHTPENPIEEKLIKQKGGFVLKVGHCLRVNGQLNVTRSFGDKKLKKLLLSEPSISTYRIGKDDQMLIMATDGLWSMAPEDEVARIAIRGMQSVNPAQSILINLKKRPIDNVTILCLKLL